MNRILLLAALLGVVTSPRPVNASPPVACPDPRGELLDLIPESAHVGGLALARSPTTGRYVSDAGLEFDMEGAKAHADTTGSMPGCEQPSGLVALDVIDPFTNLPVQVMVEVRP